MLTNIKEQWLRCCGMCYLYFIAISRFYDYSTKYGDNPPGVNLVTGWATIDSSKA